MPGLTPKQSAFVAEYLVDQNATQAAVRAGYSPRTAEKIGSENLRKPEVKRAIDEALDRRAKRVEVKADDVLRELIRLAQADPARAFDEKGNLLPIHEMPPEARAAIAGFDLEELWDGRGPKRKQVGRVRKVRFWDKPRALELLAKHLGLLTERLQVSVLTLEQLVEASRKEPP